MPKMKTNRAMAKRFKVTKSGGLKYKKSCSRHLKSHKGGKKVRQLRNAGTVPSTSSMAKRVKRALGR